MATKSISQLDTQATANETDLFEVAIVDQNSASGYASKKETAAAIADAIVGEYQYPLRITGTTAKTIAGAINELKNLVDLLPQFAIEVVNTLPVSDISTTTIYLVPAQDPEQGNYYEEYIYVNNAWELVGTTAVDLSGYYTSAQVDTLLAAKANTSSLATVATSGAYSDLSGKPTIDTALDTTSTNAVENRAVAGAINSIESDLQDKADIITNSASGAIASFSDGANNLPVKDLTIAIDPVQSGTGDPSPTNIRPISGWTGAKITRSGVNLCSLQLLAMSGATYQDLTNNSVMIVSSSSSPGYKSCRFKVCDISPFMGKTMRIKMNATQVAGEGKRVIARYYNADGTTQIGTNIFEKTTDQISTTFVVPDSMQRGAILAILLYSDSNIGGENSVLYSNIELSIDGTASDFKPYNGNTYNINWQTEAGTVYGGMLDVTSGVLTVTHENIASYDGETINEPWISSKDEYIAGATPTTGAQVVYPLTTPQTYQLTSVEVKTLLGQNNIWADTGDSSVSYRADTKKYIDAKIAELQALILNS